MFVVTVWKYSARFFLLYFIVRCERKRKRLCTMCTNECTLFRVVAVAGGGAAVVVLDFNYFFAWKS